MRKTLFPLLLALGIFQVSCRKDLLSTENSASFPNASLQLPPLCSMKEDAVKTNAALARKANRTASSTPVVLLLDFNGYLLENSSWNPGAAWTCPPVPASKLSKAMKDEIVAAVAEDYSAFRIIVTRNEAQYEAADPDRRMRCVITHHMISQFGNVGGTAFVGSMAWADNTPCFVFCDPLLYNAKYIAGAVAHELGHTFGLQHQARYDAGCSMQEEYHSGEGEGALGWAPVMGLSYYKQVVTWHEGPSVLGCQDIQDDVETITQTAAIRADDFSDALSSSAAALPVTGTQEGCLEQSCDSDVFWKKETMAKRIQVTSGGNADIALEVYNMNGKLVAVYDDPEGTGVAAVINGKKWLKVRVSATQPFVPEGNGFGGYTIRVTLP